AIAQSLVGKAVSVLEDRQPRHQPRRQRRLARFVGVHRPERILQKTPIDRPPQLHQRVFHVDDLIKPRAEQILLAGLPSLAWSHRKSPLHQREREESWLAIRGNPQNRIRKEIALQRPKTGKFDYLSQPNHPAHSIAFKFFTDDYVRRRDHQFIFRPHDHTIPKRYRCRCVDQSSSERQAEYDSKFKLRYTYVTL